MKNKNSQDEINGAHSRIHFIRPQKKLRYFRT